MAVAMDEAGIDVTVWPTSICPGLPVEFTNLLTKNPTGAHDVVMTFAPPFDIHPDEFAELAPKAVGYSMWEKSKLIPADMKGHGWDMRRRSHWWDGLDMMLVTCSMNVDAFKALDPHVRYDVLACGIDGDFWIPKRRDRSRKPMRFGMIGMLAGRKDPFLLLGAWKELKEERPEFDAVLELKTSCAGIHPRAVEVYPDLVLYDRAWTGEKVRDWYHSLDVLISVSRGEGNNKPAMEFMATGGTVIASDWSGHHNWLHPAATYALRGELHPAGHDPDGPLDFRADKEHLKELLWHCWTNRDEVENKGRVAEEWIRATLDWSKVVGRLEKILVDL